MHDPRQSSSVSDPNPESDPTMGPGTPRWVKVFAIAAVIFILTLVVTQHLFVAGIPGGHFR